MATLPELTPSVLQAGGVEIWVGCPRGNCYLDLKRLLRMQGLGRSGAPPLHVAFTSSRSLRKGEPTEANLRPSAQVRRFYEPPQCSAVDLSTVPEHCAFHSSSYVMMGPHHSQQNESEASRDCCCVPNKCLMIAAAGHHSCFLTQATVPVLCNLHSHLVILGLSAAGVCATARREAEVHQMSVNELQEMLANQEQVCRMFAYNVGACAVIWQTLHVNRCS